MQHFLLGQSEEFRNITDREIYGQSDFLGFLSKPKIECGLVAKSIHWYSRNLLTPHLIFYPVRNLKINKELKNFCPKIIQSVRCTKVMHYIMWGNQGTPALTIGPSRPGPGSWGMRLLSLATSNVIIKNPAHSQSCGPGVTLPGEMSFTGIKGSVLKTYI